MSTCRALCHFLQTRFQEDLSEFHFSSNLSLMIKLNIHQAKTHLSRYLKDVEAGETILLCRHNVPIAEIRPLPKQRKTSRQLGTAKGKVAAPLEFFEPLPAFLLPETISFKPAKTLKT